MSELLDALITQRKQEALDYQKYLEAIVELAKQVINPSAGASYPKSLDSQAKRALYDNLGRNETLALEVDQAIRSSRQDEWRSNALKIKKVKLAIKAALENRMDEAVAVPVVSRKESVMEESPSYGVNGDDVIDALVDLLLELAKNQNEY
jgi:type I restriction enzyme R subunit